MRETNRYHNGQKTLVCVDSYHNGVLKGRLYHNSTDPETFESLTQFLVKMEKLLNTPSADATSPVSQDPPMVLPLFKGAEATFQVQVLFRHNTSWQGVLVWPEERRQQRFRSALSLILAIDSTLVGAREGDAV